MEAKKKTSGRLSFLFLDGFNTCERPNCRKISGWYSHAYSKLSMRKCFRLYIFLWFFCIYGGPFRLPHRCCSIPPGCPAEIRTGDTNQWAVPHLNDSVSYATPQWSMPHPNELCHTSMIMPHPNELCHTSMSYATPQWAMPHLNELCQRTLR